MPLQFLNIPIYNDFVTGMGLF